MAAGRVTDRHRLRELRRGERAGAPEPRRLRDGGDAVRGTPVGAVARPRQRRPHAGPAAARRAPAAARRASPRTADRRSSCSARASARGRARTRSSTAARKVSSTPGSTTRSGSGPRTSASGRSRCSSTAGRTSTAARSACSATSTSGTRLDADERAGIRYVMITHHDDGVAALRPRARDPGTARGSGRPRPARPQVPKGMRWMPSDGVLPGARRHEELGHRRAREVRGEGPRLPRRPAALLPRRARLRRDRRSSSTRIATWLELEELQRQRVDQASTARRARASPSRSSSGRSRELQEQGLDADERLAQIVRGDRRREARCGRRRDDPARRGVTCAVNGDLDATRTSQPGVPRC